MARPVEEIVTCEDLGRLEAGMVDRLTAEREQVRGGHPVTAVLRDGATTSRVDLVVGHLIMES